MAVLWALFAALGWGGADFLARIAGDRIGSQPTAFFSQFLSAGLLLALLVISWPSAAPTSVTWSMLALALFVGALNALGIALLYEAIRRGPVSLVSPVASSFGALAALLAVLGGERPGVFQWFGIAVIGCGVVGSTLDRSPTGALQRPPGGVLLACAAALCWGAAFSLLGPVFGALGLVVPILICRLMAVTMLRGAQIARCVPFPHLRGAIAPVVGISLLDTGAFLSFGCALDGGMTSVPSVVASLFSTVAILLAVVFLGERLRGTQWAAVGVLLLGIGLAAMK